MSKEDPCDLATVHVNGLRLTSSQAAVLRLALLAHAMELRRDGMDPDGDDNDDANVEETIRTNREVSALLHQKHAR